MSVINDMLKDLDQRRAPARESIAGAQGASLVQAAARPVWLLWLLAAALLLVLGLGYAFWPQKSGQSATPIGIVHQGSIEALGTPEASVAQSLASRAVRKTEANEDAKTLSEPVQQTVRLESTEHSNPSSTVVATKQRVVASGIASSDVAATDVQDINPVSKGKPSATPSPKMDVTSDIKRQVDKTPKVLEQDSSERSVEEPNSGVQVVSNSSAPKSKEQIVSPVAAATNEVRLTPIALDQKAAEDALMLFSKGEADSGRRLLYDFIAEHEQDSYSRTQLTRHLLQAQRLAEAGDLLTVVDANSIPQLKAVKARWLVSVGRINEALILLSENMPPVAEHSDYHALLASFYHQQKQFDLAVERYSALLEHDSNKGDWWVGMGIGLDQLKRYDDAELAYRQALALPNLKQSLARFSTQRLQQLSMRRTSDA